MKSIIANLDVFTLVKLEKRAAQAKLTLEHYVALFLAQWVEPITKGQRHFFLPQWVEPIRHERNDNMTSENMMSELRRIVGVYMGQREAAVMAAAKEGAKTTRPAEKAAAYALGKADGIGRVLEELTQAFDIDPWTCAAKEGAE